MGDPRDQGSRKLWSGVRTRPRRQFGTGDRERIKSDLASWGTALCDADSIGSAASGQFSERFGGGHLHRPLRRSIIFIAIAAQKRTQLRRSTLWSRSARVAII